MKWYVRLNGKDYELQCLSEVISSEDISVELEENENQLQYILKSNQFNQCIKLIEVLNKAKEFIEMVNGIGNLTIDFYNNVYVDSVGGIDEKEGKWW
ncbi:hypothetical protein [Bacillus salipaludis]|uniref:hypothetical protein n=1 Tax=Bacillus salipaludis TaxID=2547811 RepID=UPI002E23FFFD|nr:hypothetical protein [Bacillus salipaludis]